jgi:hypothetical protein
MPYGEWRDRYQTEASEAQKQAFDVAFAENVGTDKSS